MKNRYRKLIPDNIFKFDPGPLRKLSPPNPYRIDPDMQQDSGGVQFRGPYSGKGGKPGLIPTRENVARFGSGQPSVNDFMGGRMNTNAAFADRDKWNRMPDGRWYKNRNALTQDSIRRKLGGF